MAEGAFLGVERSFLGRSWRLRELDEARITALTREAGVSDATARVLAGRGIEALGAHDFLRPTLKALMPDPSAFIDMDAAVARIVRAIDAKEAIAVFGDYDVDGATSSALLIRFFRAIGIAITPYKIGRAHV